MKSYIISIAVTSVIAAAVNIISPEKWTKYTGLVTGLVMSLCIGAPIFELVRADVFSGFRFESRELSGEGERAFYDELRRGLEERVEQDVRTWVKSEFGRDCEADAEVSTNDEGQIIGVERITIYGSGFDSAVTGRLMQVYGAREAVIGGAEKVSRQAE